MYLKTTILLIIIILTHQIAAYKTKPLKALLYCYIPAFNEQNPLPEFQKLASMINKYLLLQNINVQVQVCNFRQNGTDLYDQQKINQLFQTYDIMEIDDLLLHQIKAELMSFNQTEIDYYDSVFEFEWKPITRMKNGHKQFIGSPGLICSYFLQTRKDKSYSNRLYADFNRAKLNILYLETFINLGQNRTLQNVNYNKVDDEAIDIMALFLKDCQSNNAIFDYDSNWCVQPQQFEFLSTNYSKSVGFSEQIYRYQNFGINPSDVQIKKMGIPNHSSKPKRLYFLDSFIAKKQADRQTVLQFYKFMLSDKVLDLYVKGLYTNSPKTTYIIPPTISYLSSLKNDRIYQSIIDNDLQKSQIIPFHQIIQSISFCLTVLGWKKVPLVFANSNMQNNTIIWEN